MGGGNPAAGPRGPRPTINRETGQIVNSAGGTIGYADTFGRNRPRPNQPQPISSVPAIPYRTDTVGRAVPTGRSRPIEGYNRDNFGQPIPGPTIRAAQQQFAASREAFNQGPSKGSQQLSTKQNLKQQARTFTPQQIPSSRDVKPANAGYNSSQQVYSSSSPVRRQREPFALGNDPANRWFLERDVQRRQNSTAQRQAQLQYQFDQARQAASARGDRSSLRELELNRPTSSPFFGALEERASSKRPSVEAYKTIFNTLQSYR